MVSGKAFDLADHSTHDRDTFVSGCEECLGRFLAWLTRDRVHMPTGFPTLDRLTYGGIEPGTFMVVGGLTSTGKSLLGLAFLEAARRAGHDVAVMAYEMAWVQWVQRATARIGILESSQLEDQAHVFSNLTAFTEAARMHFHPTGNGRPGPGRLIVRFEQDATREGMIDRIRQLAKLGTRLVLLDYIQIVRARGRRSRFEEIEDVVTDLKHLALQQRVGIVALGQLHRAAADRSPHVGNFYGASAIEHAADLIGLLDHTQIGRLSDHAKSIPFRLKKNRLYGLLGGLKVHLDKRTLTMTELEELPEQEERQTWDTKTHTGD